MHSHGHSHTHGTWNVKTRMFLAVLLNIAIAVIQIVGGIISGSLSLISDSIHNLSDGVSLVISYFAIKLKYKDNSHKHTFGLKRAEIVAAFINSASLVGIAIYLFYEAIKRFMNPQTIEPGLMGIIAFLGLIGNILGVLLLIKDSKESMNIKSAYLHLISDSVSSVAIIIGAVAIYYWQIYWIDPLLTILIGIYILKASFSILIASLHILMEGAPSEISLQAIHNTVTKVNGVVDIHHIHLWTVGENDIHLEAHVNINDMMISESGIILEKIENLLKDNFSINHITLQFECEKCKGVGLIKEHKH